MLKTIGLCVMVISGAGFGLALSGELSRRKRHLEKLLHITILLKGEIHLCTMPLPVQPVNWMESTENFF